MVLRVVGTEKVMYGSDELLNLIRSTPNMHPEKGERLATEYPYHWVDNADYQAYKHLATGVTYTHWQTLQAVKKQYSLFLIMNRIWRSRSSFTITQKQFYGF